MSMMQEATAPSYPSYHAQLIAERKARRARIAAAAVHDDWNGPRPVAVIAPQPVKPWAPVIDECSAWMAAEHRLFRILQYTIPREIAAPAPIILAAVGRHFNLSRTDLCSQRRTVNVVRPRHIAMYLVKMLTGASLPLIGRLLGGRDHTTALNGIRKITRLRPTDESIAIAINSISVTLAKDGFDVSPLSLDVGET